jgi:hypothetical protein
MLHVGRDELPEIDGRLSIGGGQAEASDDTLESPQFGTANGAPLFQVVLECAGVMLTQAAEGAQGRRFLDLPG